MRREEITIGLAKKVLTNILEDISFTDITINTIIRTVCNRMNVTERQMLGKGRTMEVALARQLAMFFCKELTEISLANIGAHLGGRDHSTVIHACKNIDKKISLDVEFANKVNNMKNKFLENN